MPLRHPLVTFGCWAAAALFLATPSAAHDMWIEPTSFAPSTGQVVPLKLRVGQDLLGDPLPYDAALVREFVVADGAARRPVVPRPGADPAGLMRVTAPGLLVVAYGSRPSTVQTSPETFNAYLREEGLDTITALRASRGETGARARELFARCAKSLILSGPADATQRDVAIGLPLELVAERNPYALGPGQSLPVRLTYQQQPLAGALVVAINRRRPTEKLRGRTDRDGRVTFALRPGGMWLIKAVHMVPAPAGSGADWSSYWASLTFEPAAAERQS